MSDDQFTKLFKYMMDMDERMKEGFENTAQKDDLEHLRNTMDDFIRQITDNNAENAARDAQFARLLEWAREVSKKTGVPLPNL
jgi:uncharacterized protein YdcH (DUF465 family)